MKRRPYINDPHWRTVWELVDRTPWWISIFTVPLFFLVMLPVVLVMRLFGWRPKDE